jgi:uncharacterized protein YbjQ (UPF0145 family)
MAEVAGRIAGAQAGGRVDESVRWDPGTAIGRRAGRFAQSGLRTSMLSVPAAVSAEAVGLTPIGDVMGCIVQQISPQSAQMTGMATIWSSGPDTRYADALRHGYHQALARLSEEAKAIGADGVVGITMRVADFGEYAAEFVAMGTAVRAECRTRPAKLFTTGLSGEDVAKLMLSGWAPVELVLGLSVVAVPITYLTMSQVSITAGNVEVDTYTTLVNSARAKARDEFERQTRKARADGAIVSEMTLSSWPVVNAGVAALAGVFGTAIARFHTGQTAPTSTLKIMPLKKKDSR